MSKVIQTAPRRNAQPGSLHLFNVNHPDHRDDLALTPGGREIFRRMHWSPSLCNAVAALAGYAEISH